MIQHIKLVGSPNIYHWTLPKIFGSRTSKMRVIWQQPDHSQS